MQRLRALPQDERTEQAPHQTQAQAGESHQCCFMREKGIVSVCVCVSAGGGGGGSK